jgi:hypothetical protein
MPAPTKAKTSQAFPALSRDRMFLLTPDQHLTMAKDLRRQVNDPKAQNWRSPTKSWRRRYRSASTNKWETAPRLGDMAPRGRGPAAKP